jgi:cytochrome b
MNGILVFDAPLRLLHWMLVAHFLAALLIATLAGEKSVAFAIHALLGMVLMLLVVLRLVWGVIGTRWARFSSLDLRPAAMRRYLTAVVSGGSGMARAGHNPATSWFLVLVLPLLVGVGVTGLLAARGNERLAELHQVLAWAVLGLAAIHLLGVFWHLARTGENLIASMVSGRRRGVQEGGIPSSRPLAGLLLILVTGAFAVLLFSHLDVPNRRLTVFGASLTIGEVATQPGRTP